MVRSSTLNNALATQQQSQFKNINNLLTLQDNHVEEFFQYHGAEFLTALEKLLEDVTERVVSKMLSKLEFVSGQNGHMTIQADCLREYERITEENIQLDIQAILMSAINEEVVGQRRMAKQQYLESQGISPQTSGMGGAPQQGGPQGNIQGQPMGGQMNQQMSMQQNAMNNTSGYPVPPAGYDNYNNPYWIDQNTGQMTYSPPSSGLGLGKMVAKGAAWAKWLA